MQEEMPLNTTASLSGSQLHIARRTTSLVDLHRVKKARTAPWAFALSSTGQTVDVARGLFTDMAISAIRDGCNEAQS